MTEASTRIVHFKVVPWLQAYLDWPQTVAQLSGDHILHVIDAFHSGWNAAQKAQQPEQS